MVHRQSRLHDGFQGSPIITTMARCLFLALDVRWVMVFEHRSSVSWIPIFLLLSPAPDRTYWLAAISLCWS
jgi:hypothetical protein